MVAEANTSIIITSYHTGPALWLAIHSALKQAALKELILVDNGNPPQVVEKIRALGDKRLVLLTGHGNVGFAKGCNLGAAAATGDYLLFLNPDCLLPDNALQELSAAYEQADAMLAGCLLKNPDGSEQRGGRREIITPLNALAESFRLPFIKRVNHHETPVPEGVVEVPAISGACMFIGREHYHALGGMDEGYFLHVEDMDFCLRVARAGGKTIVVPQVEVLHFRSTSEVSSTFIEWQKCKSFHRYFHTHFKGLLSWLVTAGLLARFLCKLLMSWRGRKDDASLAKLLLLHHYATLPQGDGFAEQQVVVTGARSALGLCVIGRLLSAGAKVVALTRRADIPYHHPNLTWLEADISQPLPPFSADMLVHAAPLWLLPQVMGRFAAAGVKKLVAFGSTSVFGKAGSGNTHERQLVTRLHNAESALQVMCRSADVEWLLLRPTMIYGAGLDHNIMAMLRVMKRTGCFPLNPPAKGLRSPVHVDDLAVAAMQALQRAQSGGCYNVSGGEILSYRDMAQRVGALAGRKVRLLSVPLLPLLLDILGLITFRPGINGAVARRMNDDLVFNNTDARRDFGYAPRPFLSGGLEDVGKA